MSSHKGSVRFGNLTYGVAGEAPCPSGYQSRMLKQSVFCIHFTKGSEKAGEVWEKVENRLVLRGFFNRRNLTRKDTWLGATPSGAEFRAVSLHEIVMRIVEAPLL